MLSRCHQDISDLKGSISQRHVGDIFNQEVGLA